MHMENPQVWIAFAGLLFTIGCTVGGTAWALSWRMSGMDKEARRDNQDALRDAVAERDRAIADLARKINEVAESLHRSVAAVDSAAIQNIQRVELFIRDQLKHYVLKEDFRDDLETITKIVDSLGNRIETRMGNMEKKLDDLRDRIPSTNT
jgi:phage-related minor tail protein